MMISILINDLKQAYPAFVKADETYLPDALESVYQNSADEKKVLCLL